MHWSRWAGRRLLVVAVLAAGLGLLAGPAAAAHARLVSSQPGAGQPLGADRVVTLTFDDPVDIGGSSVTVTAGDQSGTVTGLRHVAGDATTLTGTVPTGITVDLTVHWKALSDDGHTTTGSFGLAGASLTAVPKPVDRTGVAGSLTVVRALSFIALLLLVGGLAFIGGVWPAGAEVARARSLLWGAWGLGVVSSVAGLGLLGAMTKQLGLRDALRLDVFRDVLATHVGHAWMARLLLYGLAIVVLRALAAQGTTAARSIGWRLGAAAVGIGLLRTPGLAAHATEGQHAVLGSVADLAHLLGAAVWIGGLVMLCLVVLPRRNAAELECVVPRYSTAAFVSVLVIVSGGAVLTWQLVGGLHPLVATHYGHVLLIKVGVFLALLVAAQRSKRWVEHRLDMAVILGGDQTVVAPFVRSVAAEVALAIGVLSAAAVLVSTNPVR